MEVLGSLFVKKERWVLKMLVPCASNYDRKFTIRETECYAGLICMQFAISPTDKTLACEQAPLPTRVVCFESVLGQ